MAGRRPRPTAVKEITGNPGHRPLHQDEPKPGGIPDCPEHLDEVAKQEWGRVAGELIQCGLLANVDRAALAAYCSTYARWIKAEKNLAAVGEVVKSPSGYPIQNPYVSIAHKALEQMHKFMTEFGMTPSSRARVAGGQPNTGAGASRGRAVQDPADKYFAAPVVAPSSGRVQ